jgi:hypothetical protein
MPVTAFGSSPVAAPGPGAAAAPAAAAAAAPPPLAAMPAGDVVGHGVTRLMAHRSGAGTNAPFIPGVPPPRGETAGAHGAHKGRISIR